MRRLALVAALVALPLAAAARQDSVAESPAASASITTLPVVTVTGVQPGPGLWKISRGDHVMYVLGVSSPLPKNIEWDSAKVARAIAGSQAVIEPPKVAIHADVGFFGKLFLLPAVWGARKNEDGRTLEQIVSPGDYALWRTLKATYIGRDSGIERWRPIFAALKLAHEALSQHGLSSSGGVVTDKVRALARQYQVPLVSATYKIDVKDPRAAIRAFEKAGPDDLTCFHLTMVALATQLPVITERANAWATGDINALRNIRVEDPREVCKEAVTEAGFARSVGLADLHQRARSVWLTAALNALKTNRQTFAVLPMDQILPYNGYLAVLASDGYTLTPPAEAGMEGAPAGASSAAATRTQ